MENFKQIDKCDVWPHLQAGKRVEAVVFSSNWFKTGIKDLQYTDVRQISQLLEEKNVVFYEEIEVEKQC